MMNKLKHATWVTNELFYSTITRVITAVSGKERKKRRPITSMFLPSPIPFPDALHPFQSLSLIPFFFRYLPYIFTPSPFTLFHIYHLFQSPSLEPFASLDPSHFLPSLVPFTFSNPFP